MLDSSTHSIDYKSTIYHNDNIPTQFNFKSILFPLNHMKELQCSLFLYTKDCHIHESWYTILNNPIYHTFIISISLLYWISRGLVLYEFNKSSDKHNTYFWISLIWSISSQIPMSAIACKYISDRYNFEDTFKPLGTLIFLIFASIIFVETGPFIPIYIYFLRRYSNFNHLDTAHI